MIIKVFLAGLVCAVAAASVSAQTYVKPYTRSDGTTVQGHYRSSPNSTALDNYSTRGNVNPYTGQIGTRDPYPAPSAANGSLYGSPKPAPNPYSPKKPF